MIEEKKKVLLTAFPTVKKSWNEIIENVKSRYEISQTYTFDYLGDDWHTFFLRMYNISNMFVEESFLESVEQNNILNSIDDHLRKKGDAKKHRNFYQVLQKSNFLLNFSKNREMLAIPVMIKSENFRPLMNLKNEIRDAAIIKHQDITRWAVIHSFNIGENSEIAEDFIVKNCKILNF